MHYYKFNIADYRADTGHLCTIEHGIYRQLIDWQYLDERPIPLETQVVIRRLRLGSDEEKFLENILSEFFEKTEKGYFQRRISMELRGYQENAEKNKNNGKLGGRPRKTQSVILDNPNETQVKGNHKPITINQEPIDITPVIKKRVSKKLETSIPDNFAISERVQVWAKEKGFGQLDDHLESFKEKCLAKGYKYLDWDAGFMGAIRGDWAKLRTAKNNSTSDYERLIGRAS